MAEAARLDSLPVELVVDIFVTLLPLDILHCRQICSKLKDIIDTSNTLNMVIDMYEHGYLLVYPIQRPLKEIWDNFVENRRYLMEGDPTGNRKMILKQDPWVLDGILVRVLWKDDEEDLSDSCQLELCDVTSLETKWVIDFEFEVDPLCDCAVSKGSGLLAVAQSTSWMGWIRGVKLCLFDLYHGTPHLEAQATTLVYSRRPPGSPSARNVATTIYGDYVGLINTENRVLIWNWRSGTLLRDLENIDSYVFISETYILNLPARRSKYDRSVAEEKQPTPCGINVTSISTGQSRTLQLPLSYRLEGYGFNAVSVGSRIVRSPIPGIFGTRGEYVLDKALDIVVLDVRPGPKYNVVISCRKLHNNLVALHPTTSQSSVILWRVWGGPEVTRWIPRQGNLWVENRPLSGSILTHYVDDGFMRLQPTETPLRRRFIMDFNHRPIFRRNGWSDDRATCTITERWKFSDEGYTEDVECQLPFRTMTTYDIVDREKTRDDPMNDVFI